MLNAFHEAGIPTVVWLCPILPFLNDTEENLQGILEGCFAAGVRGILCFGMGVTLRQGDREYFYAQLDRRFPGMKERYIRAYGDRYQCSSPNQVRLMARFRSECRRRHVLHTPESVFAYLRKFEDKEAGEQLSLL